MLIRRLFNSPFILRNAVKHHLSKQIKYLFTQYAPIQTNNKKQLLAQVLKDVKMLDQSSLFMEETQQIENIKKRTLTKQDKLKLGLYVPKMTINPRMNVESQLSYRQKICQNLYELQKSHLETQVRILQKITDSQHFTMDKYINTVYKDIYARYLVNKGIGIEWKGRFSSYGMLNQINLSTSPSSLVAQFIKANIQDIEKIQSIAPYSYLTQTFIPTDLIQVENIRKIGYYIKLPLTEFGDHKKSFQKLNESGSKVEILVFCQFLQKLINPHCLCLIPGQKMIILKKLLIQKLNLIQKVQTYKDLNQNNQSNIRYEYLITSLEAYNKHKQYFTGKQYQKHLVFESDNMIGMKAGYKQVLNNSQQSINLSIIGQIEGYQRNPGFYIVNGSTSIPDYDRVQQFKSNESQVNKMINVLSSDGKLNLLKDELLNNQISSKNHFLSIIDLQFQQKLLQILKLKLNFQDLYDVFEDQVYSNKQTSQVLRFRLFDKFQIPIKDESYRILENYFSTISNEIVLHESKVKLPEYKKFHKPRERRAHKKQVRQSLKQRTDYMSLQQSIKSITNIPISSSVKGDLKIWLQKDENEDIVNVHQNKNENNQKSKLEQVTISTDLISAMTFLSNTQHSHDLTSIIIEPQTFTEQILPLCLHLTLFKNKQQPIKRGRKTTKSDNLLNKKLLQSMKMIYLHPTIKPNQRDMEVHSFITGSLKISNKSDYGFGFEAIRLWVCRHSNYLGDRQLKQSEVNEQLKNSTFIRKLYAQIIPLVPKGELLQTLQQIQFEKLNFLDRFMHDQIDAYVLNMQHFYSRLMLNDAYSYTMDFFKNIVDEIFISTVRHHIITYPNQNDNLSHGVTIKRILQLLSVISPLFPFSAFHISKTQIMKWPEVKKNQNWYKNLLEYNALIKIRTDLRNKLQINKFSHCQIVFPLSDLISYNQEDLKKFFGADKISFTQPEVKQKKFKFQLRYNETMGGKNKISVYESKDNCIRCDPNSKQKQKLCHNCMQYLQTNVGKQIEYFDKRNNSLLISTNSTKQSIHQERI